MLYFQAADARIVRQLNEARKERTLGMRITSRLLARLYTLPPAHTYDIAIDTNLEVLMPDDVMVRAGRYYPRNNTNLPTLLIRTTSMGLFNVQIVTCSRRMVEDGYDYLRS